MKAVVLLSGGLDSTTCLAIAKSQGYDCYALSFDYGQKNRAELNSAMQVAEELGVVRHEIVRLSIDNLKGSALTDADIDVPDYAGNDEIPITYVPARNTTFLSIALGWAEILNAKAIFIGVSAMDYSGYPDCRPEYIKAYQQMANLATKTGVEGNPITIKTPLIHLTKADTIRTGHELGVNYAKTITCYRATSDGLACGTCDSCTYRKKGFREAGIKDVTLYVDCSNSPDA